jgi:hypothetical protein
LAQSFGERRNALLGFDDAERLAAIDQHITQATWLCETGHSVGLARPANSGATHDVVSAARPRSREKSNSR